MNPHYKDSVIVFGLVAPVLLVSLALGLGIHFRGKLEKTYEARKEHYRTYKMVETERKALERKVQNQSPHMSRWMMLFDKPAATKVNTFFRQFEKEFDSTQFQCTAFHPKTTPGAIGGVSDQASAQLHFSFRGTFRALQTAVLELETRMPQLQLDSIKLSSGDNRNVLNATVVYTAWQR